MIMALISRLVSAWFAFLIPCYHTWKALSHRPHSDPDLERWAMYWTCVGAFVAFENVAEWFVSWLPFYWEFRTLFLLFMALDQTQGSTWFYNIYVQPFFRNNEADLDAGIMSAQTKTFAFIQSKLSGVWDALWRLATSNGTAPPAAQGRASGTTEGTAPPPAVRASLYALGTNLFHTYGPWAMGALSKTAESNHPSVLTPGVSPSPTPQSQNTPTPGMQSRRSYMSGEEQNAPPPSFPTPQHY